MRADAALQTFRTIAAPFHPQGGGPLGVWRATQDWARHRSLTIATRADPAGAPILVTRVGLGGDVRTKVDLHWLHATRNAPDGALVARHFKAVRAALAGWPAALAFARLVSWAAWAGLAVLMLRDIVAAGLRDALALLLSWHFWLPVTPLLLATLARPLLRLFIRWRFRKGL